MTRNDEINATALARFFSSSVLKELAARGCSPSLARLIGESDLHTDPHSTEHIGTVFDLAFDHLKRRVHRHEYVYKAALMQKVLLGIHSLKTASMITEFRVGPCKADVVLLNETGTVYEIKSERDNLSRLSRQVDEYSRVFASVNVIAGDNHLREVESSVPDHVGIMELSNRYRVRTLKRATVDPARTNPAAIFDAINQREASRILKSVGMNLPDVPNTQRYAALRELFAQLDPETAHRGMVESLKFTRNLRPLSGVLKSVPKSLYARIIAAPMNRREQQRVVDALRTPICEALAWG